MLTPAWARDDSFVSFGGLKNTQAGVLGGLFVMTVDWSSGSPCGSVRGGCWTWKPFRRHRRGGPGAELKSTGKTGRPPAPSRV